MASGLAALLDDIAVLARTAAASVDDVAAAAGRASVKAAGVVVDDAAVTPRFVEGLSPKRELPIIWKIFLGSIRNKLVFIIPILLLLSAFAPWALTPLLMLGGSYLCFEGVEKILEHFTKKGHAKETAAVEKGPDAEKKIISGAIRTDLILSAEIMMISLGEIDTDNVWMRLAILIVVAIIITIAVYGVVAIIVKMDDVGLHLASKNSAGAQKFGLALVKGMPKLLSALSIIGIIAMTWVGGHIILVGTHDLGWHAPYELVHHLADPAHAVVGIGGFLAWLIDTICSFIVGLIWGAVLVGLWKLTPWGKHH